MHSTGHESSRHQEQSEITGLLAALDWHEITCQADGGCTNRATHVVHRHAVDKCNQADLDPFGSVVEILCAGCVSALKTEVARQVDRIRRGPHGFCLTCGTPVDQLSYVIRRAVRLAQPRTPDADQ